MKSRDQRGYFEALIGDGRPLLTLTGLLLVLSGGFAMFLSATRHFLPHDIQFLGMTAEACARSTIAGSSSSCSMTAWRLAEH